MANTVAYNITAVIAVVKCLVGLGRKEGKKNVIKRMVSQMSKILLKNSRV
jgi:hypothetical protein